MTTCAAPTLHPVPTGDDWPLADAKRARRQDTHSTDTPERRGTSVAPVHCRQELQVNTIAISHQPVDGVEVRVAKSDGDRDETLILTCPWPESLYAFESTWEDTGEEFAALTSAWVGGQYRDVG